MFWWLISVEIPDSRRINYAYTHTNVWQMLIKYLAHEILLALPEIKSGLS